MKVKHGQSFDVFKERKKKDRKSLSATHHQYTGGCVLPSKQLPRFKLQNLTCSIDSPDNAFKDSLFALNNVKMPTAIYNPIPLLLHPGLLASSAAQTTEVLLLLCRYIRPIQQGLATGVKQTKPGIPLELLALSPISLRSRHMWHSLSTPWLPPIDTFPMQCMLRAWAFAWNFKFYLIQFKVISRSQS